MRSSIRTTLLAALAGTAVAVPAFAQQGAATMHMTYADTCDATKVTKADTEKAIKLYQLASDFIRESNYDSALDLLKRAYDTDCRAVELLLGLATVFERAGNRPEAVHALEEYLRRAPNAADRDTIEKRIRNLNGGSAPTGTAPPSASTGVTAPPSAVPSATVSAVPTASSSAWVAPTTTSRSPGGGPGAGPWVIGGVGVVAAGVGIGAFIAGSGKVSTSDKNCPDRVCPVGSTYASDGNTGRTLETVGVVSMIAGGALVGAGIIWLVAGQPKHTTTGGVTHLTPTMAPGFAGLSLGGAF